MRDFERLSLSDADRLAAVLTDPFLTVAEAEREVRPAVPRTPTHAPDATSGTVGGSVSPPPAHTPPGTRRPNPGKS